MRRSGLVMSLGCRSPAATSCSIGVNRIKFSRLISVTSTSARRARPLSKYFAAYSPAKPLPAMTILDFFIFLWRLERADLPRLARGRSHEHSFELCLIHFSFVSGVWYRRYLRQRPTIAAY